MKGALILLDVLNFCVVIAAVVALCVLFKGNMVMRAVAAGAGAAGFHQLRRYYRARLMAEDREGEE